MWGKRKTNLQPVENLSQEEIAARQAVIDRENAAVARVRKDLALQGMYREDTDAATKAFLGGIDLDGVDFGLCSYQERVFTACLDETYQSAQRAANAAAGGRARVGKDAVVRRFVETPVSVAAIVQLVWAKVIVGADVIWLPINQKSPLAPIAKALVAKARDDIASVFADPEAAGHQVKIPAQFSIRFIGAEAVADAGDADDWAPPPLFKRRAPAVITAAPEEPPAEHDADDTAHTGTGG